MRSIGGGDRDGMIAGNGVFDLAAPYAPDQ